MENAKCQMDGTFEFGDVSMLLLSVRKYAMSNDPDVEWTRHPIKVRHGLDTIKKNPTASLIHFVRSSHSSIIFQRCAIVHRQFIFILAFRFHRIRFICRVNSVVSASPRHIHFRRNVRRIAYLYTLSDFFLSTKRRTVTHSHMAPIYRNTSIYNVYFTCYCDTVYDVMLRCSLWTL